MDLYKNGMCALALAMTACFATAHAAEGNRASEAPMARPSALPMSPSGADTLHGVTAPSGVSTNGYLFIAGSAFTPRTSSTVVTYTGAGCVSAPDYVVTDVQLPDGVTVVGIRSYYYNMGQPGTVTAAFTSYDGAGGFTDHVFGSSTLNTGYNDEFFNATTPPVIDNLNNSYVAMGYTGANVSFCGIRVFYQYL